MIEDVSVLNAQEAQDTCSEISFDRVFKRYYQ